MSKQAADNLVWIDLEMTGLEVERDVILQAALIITDKHLKPLEELSLDVWQPEQHLAGMSPFVRDMHTKTGLLDRLRASRVEVADAEKRMLEKIAARCPYPAILCGNTIWQDRKFIDRYMPGLSRYLHYRMIDVSSLKLLCKSWYGEAASFPKSNKGEHDALVDIRNSIAELAHYRTTIFKTP